VYTQKLQSAGIDKVVEEAKAQYNAWKSANK